MCNSGLQGCNQLSKLENKIKADWKQKKKNGIGSSPYNPPNMQDRMMVIAVSHIPPDSEQHKKQTANETPCKCLSFFC
jgi:hypothetical protein